MDEWKECKLGDIATFKYGTMPKKDKISDNGLYPIFSGYRIVGYYDEYNLEKSELIIVARGVGGTGDAKLSPEKCFLTNLSIVVFLNENIISKKYAYYYFTLNNLRYLDSGSAQSQITISDLSKVSIKLPPLPTQQKIAAILSSLDDKIELNNKINTNLEQQAQALFKNWFVDCMNSNTKMSNIIDVRDGTHDSPKPQESGYLLVTSKHLEAYSINPADANFITKEDYEKINERSKVDTGDILISMIGTVGIVSLVIDTPVTWAIKNIGLFKTSKVPEIKYYLLNYLKCDDVRNYIEQHLAGSTQKYISLSELRNLPINIPETKVLEKFNKIVSPIYEQIKTCTNENQNLKNLRDTLLPKLMNGEIEV